MAGSYQKVANVTTVLNFKFSVILVSANVNVQSHMWLVVPIAGTGQAEGEAGQIFLFLGLGPPWGPRRGEEQDLCSGDQRKKTTACSLKEVPGLGVRRDLAQVLPTGKQLDLSRSEVMLGCGGGGQSR